MRVRSLFVVGGLAALAVAAVGLVALRGESHLDPASGAGESGGDDAGAIYDHVDNLLAKERAGEWSRGEGLVATLQLFVGEATAEDVLLNGELEPRSGTGIIEMARDYLEDGEDPGLKAEVERLLDKRLFDQEELEAMAGLKLAAMPRGTYARPNLDTQQCNEFFGGYAVNVEATPCVLVMTVNAGGMVHNIWRPVDGLFEHPWTEKHYAWAEAAILETVPRYQEHGAMPQLNVVFYVTEATGVAAEAAGHKGSQCGIGVHTSMQDYEVMKFKFDLAHEMAHCFQEENFEQPDYATRRWREEGLADYMPNFVYPTANMEWEHLWELTTSEYNSTLFERSYDNFIWFQFLRNEIGPSGMFDVVRHVGAGDQASQLASYEGMPLIFGKFHRQFADGLIADDSGVAIPTQFYAPQVEITEPDPVIIDEAVPQFGVRRLLVSVPAKLQATITLSYGGNEVEVAPLARPLGEKGNWGEVPTEMPTGDSCEGAQYLINVTSVEPGYHWELGAPSVRKLTEEECEDPDRVSGRDRCLLGRWVQDLDVLTAYMKAMDPPGFETTPYEGLQMITFYETGFVSFEWQRYKSGYKQEMTDARERPMDIGGESRLQGWALHTWAADGTRLQYTAGNASVGFRMKTWLNDKVTDPGWRNVSDWFGSDLTKEDSPVSQGAPMPTNISLGRSVGYRCSGNRLEIEHHSMPWTLVWTRG